MHWLRRFGRTVAASCVGGAGDLAVADSQLDAVLDDWVQDNYGGRFEVLKPR